MRAHFAKFDVKDYLDYIAEHVEEWTYVKHPYLKKVGWRGFIDGPESGIYCKGASRGNKTLVNSA